MTAQTVRMMPRVRMMKEARLLAWPWLAVVTLAIFATVMQSSHIVLGPFDFSGLHDLSLFVGIPLLAGLGFGAEFQHRTFALTLAQPVERSETWRLKFIMVLIAVLPPGLLLCFRAPADFEGSSWLPPVFLVIFTAAAFPATLIARSTIGGIVVNAMMNAPVFWGTVWLAMNLHKFDRLTPLAMFAIGVAILGYAVTMIWLGRRMFLRFEAAETLQSAEAFLPVAALLPEVVSEWFRCRPSGLVLNLVKREFRLLRLVWPLTVLALAAWSCLIAFHVLPIADEGAIGRYYVGFTILISLLIALLAGSVSLGEERSWGTHDWQLTLPVSPSLQWFVKLFVAMFTAVVCGALLPMGLLLVFGVTSGKALLPGLVWIWPLELAGWAFLAFWSACMVKGIVRVILLAFAPGISLGFGVLFGEWVSDASRHIMQRPFDWIISAVGPLDTGRTLREVAPLLWDSSFMLVTALSLLLGFALIQSHRMYREEASDSKLRIFLKLAPFFVAALVASFSVGAFVQFSSQSWKREEAFAKQIHHALLNVQSAHAHGGGTFHVTPVELANASPLSADAKRWLEQASIVILPGPQRVFARAGIANGFFMQSDQNELSHPYSALIRLNGHSTCVINSGTNVSEAPLADGTRTNIFYVACD